MRTFLEHFHGRAILDQGNRFFTYISLIIEFKNVALANSVEEYSFTIFFDVSQLSYKPSNFARANKPYAVG